MRTSLILLVLILLLIGILVGCAAGPNPFKATAGDHGVAGFWRGVWQGFIAPFVFVISLFKSDLNVYEIHNNGAWYNLGFLFGLRVSSAVAGTKLPGSGDPNDHDQTSRRESRDPDFHHSLSCQQLFHRLLRNLVPNCRHPLPDCQIVMA